MPLMVGPLDILSLLHTLDSSGSSSSSSRHQKGNVVYDDITIIHDFGVDALLFSHVCSRCVPSLVGDFVVS